MLPSTTPLAVSAEAFPRPGEGVEERSDETDEGAPLDGANGYSPLIRHFVPPSTPRGEGIGSAAKLTVSTKTSPLGRGGTAQAVTERVRPSSTNISV